MRGIIWQNYKGERGMGWQRWSAEQAYELKAKSRMTQSRNWAEMLSRRPLSGKHEVHDALSRKRSLEEVLAGDVILLE